jgi:hypothetical protein
VPEEIPQVHQGAPVSVGDPAEANSKVVATPRELLYALPPSERLIRTEQQVGIALRTLGLARHRGRIGGTRFRVYDLRTKDSAESAENALSEYVPTVRTGSETETTREGVGSVSRSTDSPRERDTVDPTDPTVPDD